MNDHQQKPVIIPFIKNVSPDVFDAEAMKKSNDQLSMSIGKLLQDLNTKIVIKNKDGTETVLDDPSQIMEVAFKDMKGKTSE